MVLLSLNTVTLKATRYGILLKLLCLGNQLEVKPKLL